MYVFLPFKILVINMFSGEAKKNIEHSLVYFLDFLPFCCDVQYKNHVDVVEFSWILTFTRSLHSESSFINSLLAFREKGKSLCKYEIS